MNIPRNFLLHLFLLYVLWLTCSFSQTGKTNRDSLYANVDASSQMERVCYFTWHLASIYFSSHFLVKINFLLDLIL